MSIEEKDKEKDINAEGSFRDKKNSGKRMMFKKRDCRFCSNKIEPDYKNFEQLKKSTSERGKILPARITGTCAKHQRALATEIKKARVLAYLPFDKQ